MCRAAFVLLGTLCFVCFSLPLAARIINAGSLFWLAVSVALLTVGLFPRAVSAAWAWLGKRRAGRICRTAATGILCVGVCLCLVLSGVMLWSVADAPTGECTVVVLGAGINGDRPSRMLADRLRTAAEYLKEHPDAVCVVSGGQGENEILPESTVMKRYLIELGIEDTRVYEEDASRSTEENLRYTKTLIEREGLPPAIVTVTQEFHQYRAGEYAAQAGFTDAAALSCASPLYLLPCYWAREWFAILALWLL